jgi:molybdate transport system substrate-binding protein
MRIRLLAVAVISAAVCLVAVSAQQGGSAGGELHVLSSNGIRAVLEEELQDAESAIGRHITVEYGTSTSLVQRMQSGEAFDVGILSDAAIGPVIQAGKIVASTRTDVARSGIGVGVRAGAPKPDIHNSAALKQAFMRAKGITYAGAGASRPHIEGIMKKFGIADEMQAKTMIEQGSERANAAVAAGKSELVLTLVSEIIGVPGVDLVGPLPKEVQNYVVMTAGVGAQAKDRTGAEALIKFLSGPAIEQTLKSHGMER